MKNKYKVRTDIILDEDNQEHIVYGVDVYRDNHLVKSVPDVFLECDKAIKFVCLCNDLKLSEIHIMSVIEDAII